MRVFNVLTGEEVVSNATEIGNVQRR